MEKLELVEEERALLREIAEYKKTMERDAAMIVSLDAEIRKIEGETREKMRQLKVEEDRLRSTSMSGWSPADFTTNDVQPDTPDISTYHTRHTSFQFYSQEGETLGRATDPGQPVPPLNTEE